MEESGQERDENGDLIPCQSSEDPEVQGIRNGFDRISMDSPSMDGAITMAVSNSTLDINAREKNSHGLQPAVNLPDYHHANGYHLRRTDINIVTSTESKLNSGTSQVNTERTHAANQRIADPGPPARYPDYSDLIRRKDTFILPQGGNTWPHGTAVQDIDNLSKIGFFFTGRGDLLRCFHCGLGLKDWTREDDPLFVHLKYGPTCFYLKRSIDNNLLKIYQRHIDATGDQSERSGATNGEAASHRHPEYENYNVRLASFNNWPRERRQTPRHLAEAGFFHTGLRDVVRCFSCDGGLQSWDSGDEPWIEHARWFSHCRFLREVKGIDFIETVTAAEEGDFSDFETEENTSDMAFPLFSRAAREVIEIGYSRASVAMAIEECKQKNISITKETILNILLDKQEQGETLPEDCVEHESPTMPEFSGKTKEELEQEREYYRKRIACIICDEFESNILFLPCGHHKMCEKCARDVDKCALCSEKILQKVKTFMS